MFLFCFVYYNMKSIKFTPAICSTNCINAQMCRNCTSYLWKYTHKFEINMSIALYRMKRPRIKSQLCRATITLRFSRKSLNFKITQTFQNLVSYNVGLKCAPNTKYRCATVKTSKYDFFVIIFDWNLPVCQLIMRRAFKADRVFISRVKIILIQTMVENLVSVFEFVFEWKYST